MASPVEVSGNDKVPSVSSDSSEVREKPIDDKIKLTVTPEYPEYDPAKSSNCWVDINLSAPLYEEDESKRPAVDIVAVIDRSGSMDEKLDLVKKTLQFVVSQLTASDRICLVVYDDTVDLVFNLTSVSPENKPEIEAKIDAVQTRGSTNLCGGLLKGMQAIMSRTGAKPDVSSVLLLTDGLANVGISDTAGILQAMKDPFAVKRKKIIKIVRPKKSGKKGGKKSKSAEPENVDPVELEPEPEEVEPPQVFTGTVYTFGFGSDHDAKMLKDISQAGNGVYYFIDTNEKIPESFADCLGGLLSTVGQNISLKVELSNGATISEFVAKKAPTYNANKTSAEVALGDLQSEEQRDILMEIQLPECSDLGAAGGVVSYAAVNLSYFNVVTATMEKVATNLLVERTNTGKPRLSHDLIDKQKNRILTVRTLEEAQSKADEGKFEESRQLLKETKTQLQNSATNSEVMVQGMVDDLDDLYDGMVDSAKYKHYGKKRAVNALQSHVEQRSNFSAPGKVMSYETKCKASMKGKKK